MIVHRFLSRIFYSSFENIIWRVNSSPNTIYLTFDDGPFPPLTLPLLETLKKEKVSATFFLSGKNLFKYRDQVKKLNYNNHVIGNHFFHHQPVFGINRNKIKKELILTDYLIKKYLNREATLFRPPFGIYNASVLKFLEELKKNMILWSVMSNDFKWSSNRVMNHLKKSVREGDIVVFHDSPKTTAVLLEVIPQFIAHFRGLGYQFSVFK